MYIFERYFLRDEINNITLTEKLRVDIIRRMLSIMQFRIIYLSVSYIINMKIYNHINI
jgi:hypothetical protein